MTETRVGSGAQAKLGRVEGNLSVGEAAVITGETESGVYVSGRVSFEGNSEVNCDLNSGSIEASRGIVRVGGNLIVRGEVEVEDSIYVKKDLKADEVDVGGRLSVGGSAVCREVSVGGVMEVDGVLQADSVEIGGKLRVLGNVTIRDLEVGGEAVVTSGKIEGRIEVGGRFVAESSLHFGSLEVGGVADLGPGSSGKSIEVGGRLVTRGNLECEEIDVGGDIRVDGNLKGGRIEAGGMATTTGTLEFSSTFEVGGSAEVKGEMRGRDIEIGGDLTGLKVVLTGRAEMGGSAATREGFKAHDVELSSGAICQGPLVGETVELGRGCRTDDIYARKIMVGRGSSVRQLFGESIEIEERCSVQNVQYTRSLEADDRVSYASPPEKVAVLPGPPL